MAYVVGEHRLYLERNCRLPESPAHSRRRNREGPASSKGRNSQRGFGTEVEPRRKSRPRSTGFHGSSPCKCQRLSTLRLDRLPPSRPPTKSGARAGGRRLSDRRLHRWLAGTSTSAASSHGAVDLLGLNRAHICVRRGRSYPRPCRKTAWLQVGPPFKPCMRISRTRLPSGRSSRRITRTQDTEPAITPSRGGQPPRHGPSGRGSDGPGTAWPRPTVDIAIGAL